MSETTDKYHNQIDTGIQGFPENIFIIPMRGCPVFPGMLTTIEISDQNDIEAVNQSEHLCGFGLLLLKNDNLSTDKIKPDDFYKIGTFVRVKNSINTLFGTKSLFIDTVCRFEVLSMVCMGGQISAKVRYIEEEQLSELESKAFLEALRNSLSQREDSSVLMENLKFNATNIPQATRLADYLASSVVPKDKQQEYLEILSSKQRILMVLKVLREQLTIQKMHSEIQNAVARSVDTRQKEYFLREELRFVRRQLSDLYHSETDAETDETPDEEDTLTEENNSSDTAKDHSQNKHKSLKDKLVALNLEGESKETVFGEYERLKYTDRMNPEAGVIRTYLETVTALPWNTFSTDRYDIEKARTILNHDHYGIKDVKERILEFIAVRKLKNDYKGSILCLIGPPGTGKTSIGVSIAKALNKKYYRFSVGGMRDESEIKGHRRTYLGSMPGQIIKGLKVTGTKNPVFVIDEIDKMTVSAQGDPAAALLEVLDPAQNTSFRDHYLDIPFDISNVLFIVTANTTETIPGPLLDRMECIELSGYTSQEKLNIGKKYLLPKSRDKNGLKASDIKYSDKILTKIADEYAREAGVRNFEKSLDKINRKVACELVLNDEHMHLDSNEKPIERPVKITEEKLVKYLGQPVFHDDELIRADVPGSSVGLAWTSMGGDVLSIEARCIPGKGELKLTGHLGEVMQESASIAMSYIKGICTSHGIDITWFDKNSIHLHVPEGATPKDGPSAGITMATAIYSLITNQTMKRDMAMTGELSLLGKVMPIGGLKEKVLAAGRNRTKEIIIPKFNKRDLDKLDDIVRKGIKFHLVSNMEDVLELAFPDDKYKRRNNEDVISTVLPDPDDKLANAMAKAFASVFGERK